jgi:hypothetical protein
VTNKRVEKEISWVVAPSTHPHWRATNNTVFCLVLNLDFEKLARIDMLL